MEDQVEVIKSNKGGMKVIHKGYMYTVHKKRQCGGIRWRCAQRSLHCKGSISTGVDGPPKVNMPHNHLPDLHSVALARGRQVEDFGHVTQFLDVKFEEDSVLNKMAEWSLPRKPRKSNFSTDEVDVLVDSVKEHYNILYGKYAKRATNRWIRHKAWMDILKKVNGVSIEKRTLQEVKNKWKKCQYAMKEKVSKGALADDIDNSWEDVDSMPLQERLSKVAAQEKIAAVSLGQQHQPQQVLKSQPLSPTKLKVTRQSPKVTKPADPPQSPVNEEMCLRWNSHHSNMQTAFPNILSKEQYVDVTLAAEGKTLKCHRLILSSCSPYFEEILSGISPFQHPVLFMRDIPFWILKSLCDFMYAGEVHIFQNKLEELLTVAEALKIKGLAGKSTPPENQEHNKHQNKTTNNNGGNHSNHNSKESRKKNLQEKDKSSQPPMPPSLKKNPVITNSNNYESTSHDYEDDLIDPLDLLEPLYEEAAEEKKPTTVVKPKENKYHYQPVKKPFTRRLRKRKYSEHRDPSPPPVFSFRKGTRSRPNVKIPKYYHSDYSNPPKPMPNAQNDPLLDVDEIKTEPIDVEDNNLIDYNSEEDNNYSMENSVEQSNCDSPVVITSSQSSPLPHQNAEKFKKIKLTKPIITEVHTIEETNTTPGGLEVIKITVQHTENVSEKKESDVELPQVVINENVASEETSMTVEVENQQLSTENPDTQNQEIEQSGIETEDKPEVLKEENCEKLQENNEIVESDNKIVEREETENVAADYLEVVPPENTVTEVRESENVTEVTEAGNTSAIVASLEDGDTVNQVVVDAEVGIGNDVVESVEAVSHADISEESINEETVEDVEPNDNKTEESENIGQKNEEEEQSEVLQEIQIQDVRSTALDEFEGQTEEERRTTSLNHLEQEAMNVANAINLENQAGPPDIE